MGISTHVLDTSRGAPAAGVHVSLERRAANDAWERVGEGTTDADGRLKNLASEVQAATYRLRVDVAAYTKDAFFPEVVITFAVRDSSQHYHVPLLLGPYGYTTYRGS